MPIKHGGKFMAHTNLSQIQILEAQIRECFGRIVWSHKIHEKCADLCLDSLNRLKTLEIVLSAVTTTTLLISIFGETRIGSAVAAILSTAVLAITIYTKDYDLGGQAKAHSESASKLWNIREMYISLIADIKAETLSINEIKEQRDKLQESVHSIYQNAPRTNYKAYQLASKSLNQGGEVNTGEEMTFSDAEIDRFLPKELRKTA